MGVEDIPLEKKSYTEIFAEVFPYYLCLGMSYNQFYEGDVTLTRAYLKAEEIRRNRMNEQLWLQGMYVYEAIANLSPILQAFAKQGTKAIPYPSEPYPLDKKAREDKEEREEKRKFEEMKARMNAFTLGFNKQFEDNNNGS